MKKRITALVLCFVLTFALFPTVYAAAGLDNFTAKREYRGNFMDVPSDEWYSIYVADMYRYGLVEGRAADIFAPDASMTRAEVITLACRIHSIYMANGAVFESGAQPWYAPYIDYALTNDIIDETDFPDGCDIDATRAEIAYILGRCLPQNELEAINSITRIPDINGGGSVSRYFSYPQIYSLYAAGVLTGMDEYGSFEGSNTVKRSEVMALACRLIDRQLRRETEFETLESLEEILVAGRWRNFGVTVGTAGIIRFFADGTCVTDYVHSRVYGTYTVKDGVLNISGYGVKDMTYDRESGVFGKDKKVIIQTMPQTVDALAPMTIAEYERVLVQYEANRA